MARFWSLLITGLLLVTALGCAVNQSKEIQTYRSVINGGRQITVKPFKPDEPLTLQRALELAEYGNEKLAIAGEDYLQALINKDRALSSFLLKINFVPSFVRQEKSNIGAGNPLISSLLPDKTLDLPANASLDFDPLKDVLVMNSAGLEAQRKRFLLLDSKAALLLDTALTYYQVLQAEQLYKTLEHSVTVNKKRLEDTRIRQKAGTATFIDVSQAEAQLASAKNDLIKARNDVDNGRAMLALIMGVERVDGPLKDTFEAPSSVPSMKTLMKTAEVHRQDLLASYTAVREAAKLLQVAWAGYFPSISLNLSYFFSRQSFPNDVNWTSMIQANLPIFTSGLTHANVRIAYSRLRQARLAESRIQRQVTKDLRVALDNFTSDSDKLDSYRIQEKAAADSAKKAKTALKAGLGTELGLMVSQDHRLRSDLALTDAVFKRNMDYLRLLRAEGMLDSVLNQTAADPSRTDIAAKKPVHHKSNIQ